MLYLHQQQVNGGVIFHYVEGNDHKVLSLFYTNDEIKDYPDNASPEMIEARDYTIKSLKKENSTSSPQF